MKYFLIFLFFTLNVFAEENVYMSLRSNEVNVRQGPNPEYPIKFTYKIKNLPIRILGEYDGWYKITDKDNEEGWINKNLAVKKRFLIVINGTHLLYKKNNYDSDPIFRMEENVLVEYKKCEGLWCKVEVSGKTGWVEKENTWGWQ